MSGFIYVSGPMRGWPNFNRETFAAVTEILEADGWAVHNPHEANVLQGLSDNETFATYMRNDIEAVMASDAICLLPDWRTSEGACIEVVVARALGLDFYFAAKFTNDPVEGTGWTYERLTTDLGTVQSTPHVSKEANRARI
jgi:nucleoside 2-deoxyribosyltransferase